MILYFAARLLDFCETVAVKPTVDQVEIHPFFHQKETMRPCQITA